MSGSSHPTRATIEAVQLEQLRSLVAELFPGNRFYSRKLNEAGITFDIAGLDDFCRRFPFTTKDKLIEDQRLHPPFGTNARPNVVSTSSPISPSGTGVPLRWLDTPDSWDSMLASWTEVFRAAGVTAADRVYFAFSFGPFIGFWLAFESAARLGCLCVPGGGMSSAARLRAMFDNQISALCCTPTYALRLAEVAAAEGIPLSGSSVRKMIVAGEPGGSIPAVRARLAESWVGVQVFDHHGMTEVGPVSYQCPARPGVLHVIESAYLAEGVDPARGTPVPDGEIGELVLTTLGRAGSPLLRYRTGDLVKCGVRSAERGVPCACGRFELALDGGILGRVDEMVVVRGVNVYPSAVEEVVRSCGGVAEYQVEISNERTLTEMKLRIEPSLDCPDVPGLLQRLERNFQTSLALRVPVTTVPPGTLPRFEMKGKRWVKR